VLLFDEGVFKMYVILSWIFLILIPISFLGVFYITFKKSESNIVIKLFLGVVLGTIVAFLMFYISAYIGMNLY